MSAPALPRRTAFDAVEAILSARAELDRADAAYTLAVQTASRSNQWAFVQAAAEAVHQARAALKEAEDHQ